MKNLRKVTLVSLVSGLMSLSAGHALASGMEDDPVLLKVMIDQLEVRDSDGTNPIVLEADAWVGKDLDKLWFKIDNEQVGGTTEEQELQALYSHAIDPYWDLQVGWRGDIRPAKQRNWLAFGVRGLAPYWFDIDAQFFIGENGRTAARINAEYELMFSQKLVLIPEVEANLYGKSDDTRELGSGLSNVNLGLRLAYHLRPEFAPYVGWTWNRKFGGTADHARAGGKKVSDGQFLVGISAWF